MSSLSAASPIELEVGRIVESDTHRRAGGLMGWAVSKTAGLWSRRRALRAYFLTSEASVVAIRGLLLADVLTDLVQFEPDRRYGVTSSPEMLAGKVAFLAAQASSGNRTLPLEEPDHRCHGVFWGNCDTHMHMVWH